MSGWTNLDTHGRALLLLLKDICILVPLSVILAAAGWAVIAFLAWAGPLGVMAIGVGFLLFARYVALFGRVQDSKPENNGNTEA